MDTGSKSLAQLSEEGKEKKYIALDVGAKVSGYTREYLERLCRLRKVEYLVRSDGEFAIELESLLKETHTILLSFEGVDFVDKTTLSPPRDSNLVSGDVAESVIDTSLSAKDENGIVQTIPRFGDTNNLSARLSKNNPFAYVGRSVVSDGEAEGAQEEKRVSISVEAVNQKAELATESVPSRVTHFPLPPAPPSSDTVDEKSEHAREASFDTLPQKDESAQPQNASRETDLSETSSLHPVDTPHDVQHVHVDMDDNEEDVPVRAIANGLLSPAERAAFSAKERKVITFTREEKKVFQQQEKENTIQNTLPPSVSTENDAWDQLLLGAGTEPSVVVNTKSDPLAKKDHFVQEPPLPPVVILSTEKSSQHVSTSLPLAASVAPLSDENASPYHPIKTSADAREHHEEGPLLPPLSKGSLPPREATTVSSFHPALRQKVVVFEPGTHESVITKHIVAEAQPRRVDPLLSSSEHASEHPIPRALPPESVELNAALKAEAVMLQDNPAVSTQKNQEVSSDLPKQTLAERVFGVSVSPKSSDLPSVRESQVPAPVVSRDLLRPVPHSIAARPRYTMMLGSLVVLAIVGVVGGSLLNRIGINLNSSSYVASVNAISGIPDVIFSKTPEKELSKSFFDLLNTAHVSSSSMENDRVSEKNESLVASSSVQIGSLVDE